MSSITSTMTEEWWQRGSMIGSLSGASNAPGGFSVWNNPLTCLRAPKILNLRMDPYERADVVSDQYYDWTTKNAYLSAYGIMKSAEFLETFVDYPPSQVRASFTIDQIEKSVEERSRAKMQKNNR